MRDIASLRRLIGYPVILVITRVIKLGRQRLSLGRISCLRTVITLSFLGDLKVRQAGVSQLLLVRVQASFLSRLKGLRLMTRYVVLLVLNAYAVIKTVSVVLYCA